MSLLQGSGLLLDAHTALWFFWDDARLSAAAKTLIEDSANRKLVSIASCWEIAIKAGTGKLQLGEPAAGFLNREITRNNFEILPIALSHATAVETLPLHHRDPFDRLLIVQSQIEQVPIVSCDTIFDQYLVKRLW
jgi:PIN domain nuclease of toxin-antitoxin system